MFILLAGLHLYAVIRYKIAADHAHGAAFKLPGYGDVLAILAPYGLACLTLRFKGAAVIWLSAGLLAIFSFCGIVYVADRGFPGAAESMVYGWFLQVGAAIAVFVLAAMLAIAQAVSAALVRRRTDAGGT